MSGREKELMRGKKDLPKVSQTTLSDRFGIKSRLPAFLTSFRLTRPCFLQLSLLLVSLENRGA